MKREKQQKTGNSAPVELSPAWHGGETGIKLETEQRRGTMPGVNK
jgi:hypothetical protein